MRLNTIPNVADVAANDVQYHQKCWSLARRSHTRNTDFQYESQETEDLDLALADLEIFNLVKNVLRSSPDAIFCMNELNCYYNNLIENEEDSQTNFKRYLEKLYNENISDIVFCKPLGKN